MPAVLIIIVLVSYTIYDRMGLNFQRRLRNVDYQLVDFYHIAVYIDWTEKGSFARCESGVFKSCVQSAYRSDIQVRLSEKRKRSDFKNF